MRLRLKVTAAFVGARSSGSYIADTFLAEIDVILTLILTGNKTVIY